MMHLGLLQRRPGIMPEIKDSLKELESEAKRAANLTRQLLLFSRRQAMQICTTDLNDLLSNLLKMLRRLISEHIKLVFSSGRDPLWIEADSGMIEQVIVNLCVNARDAMPNGGELKVEAYAVTLAASETLGDTQSRAGQFICLTIGDNGCGMDAETLKHIYEPFFTTKEAGKGTGLGLATVYSIVKQHHGWINVHSTPGKGTHFRIFLPAGTEPAPAKASVEQASITGGSEGVLVVEDDIGFRNMLTMSLRVLGYRVFEAANGKSAGVIWAQHSAEIGLLLADMVMPEGMNGLELCHQFALEKPSLRRIITTGYSPDRVDPVQLASEGISFLPKPFSATTLATALRECFDQKGPPINAAIPPKP
jgi:CheY-like chemotaxis protein